VAPSRIADHVGRVLGGRYRLLAPIGTGASAHVFQADDVTLRRRVAVKILHAALADDEAFLRRFRAEAQSAAGLNHPNIMRVFDWGEDADGPYLVLEYLGGGSLRDLLDAGHRLSPSQAAIVGLEAARALDYAHRRGLVHRDIKPANLLFDDESRLCIADFGLARALAEAAWTEPTGAILGTARYASPEQAKGNSVDGRADTYALAIVLVEAVTGQVPFAADTTVATLMARTERPLTAPDELGPLVPVVAAAGALDPADRADGAKLVAALEEAVALLPAPGRLPLAGASPLDASRVVDRDPTQLPRTKPKLFDREQVADPEVDSAPEVEPVVFAPSKRARRRRWWVIPIAVIAALLAVAGGAYAIYSVVLPEHAVPNLRNMTPTAASQAIADEDFKLSSSRAYSDTVEAGEIIRQDPAPGKQLRERSTIKVVVSSGKAPKQVPDLSTLTQTQAEGLLRTQGFANTKVVATPFSEHWAKGIVLDWQPQTKVAPDTTIELTVSNGPEPRTVPNLAGKTFDQAAAALTPLRLTAVKAEVFSDTLPVGQVVSTSPGAGAKAARDSRVTINVSKGVELIAVPDVRGKNVIEATNILNGAGFEVNGVIGPGNRNVTNTRPAPGSMQRRGTKIDLYTR
jgi:serine/threonine-protein kinase